MQKPWCARCAFGECVGSCGQTDGTTPLYTASREGHVEAVKALVELGAAVNQAKVGCSDVKYGVGIWFQLDSL